MEDCNVVLRLSNEIIDGLNRLIGRKRKNKTTLEEFIKYILHDYLRLNDSDCDKISLETINMKLNMINDNHCDLMKYIENLQHVCNDILFDVVRLKEEAGIDDDEE